MIWRASLSYGMVEFRYNPNLPIIEISQIYFNSRVGRGNHGGLCGSKEEWVPLTKLGRLVRTGKLRKVEEAKAGYRASSARLSSSWLVMITSWLGSAR